MGGTNTVRVGQKGRIVLPAAARTVLDAEEDSELILIVRDREVVLMSKDEAERQLQEMFAGANLVDELIAERHARGSGGSGGGGGLAGRARAHVTVAARAAGVDLRLVVGLGEQSRRRLALITGASATVLRLHTTDLAVDRRCAFGR